MSKSGVYEKSRSMTARERTAPPGFIWPNPPLPQQWVTAPPPYHPHYVPYSTTNTNATLAGGRIYVNA